MADRYRGTMYVGVTADLIARVARHKADEGSEFCAEHGLPHLVWAEFSESIHACIDHEKRVKRWRRERRFALIERDDFDWRDLFETFR